MRYFDCLITRPNYIPVPLFSSVFMHAVPPGIKAGMTRIKLVSTFLAEGHK